MWRLTGRGPVGHDDGAVGVVFAIMLIVLLGFVGMSVDLASAYAKSQEVQNGADAAALAVAQHCATSSAGCAGDDELAQDLAEGNVRLEVDTVSTDVSYPAANKVKVVAEGDHKNFFLGIFGQPSFRVAEEATAVWGAPTQGVVKMPIIFSECSFEAQGGASGKHSTIYFDKAKSAEEVNCLKSNSDNAMPGGFAYTDDGSGLKSCSREVSADGWIASQPGNSPDGCSSGDIEVGKVVLPPIYDFCWTDKKNVEDCETYPVPAPPGYTSKKDRWYHVKAFAAFQLTGYNFNKIKAGSPVPCSGSENCVSGAFVEYVTLDDAWQYGEAPDLGASIVALVD